MEMNHFGHHLPGGGYLGGHTWQDTNMYGGTRASITQGASVEYSRSIDQSGFQFGNMEASSMMGQQMAQLSMFARMMQPLMQFFSQCSQFFGFGNGNFGSNNGTFQNGPTTCPGAPMWQPQFNNGCQNGSQFGANNWGQFGNAWGNARERLTMTRTLSADFNGSCQGVQKNKVKTGTQGQTAHMETEKYKVDVNKANWGVTVTNKETGKKQTFWGDPHAEAKDGKQKFDFKGNLTVQLEDGNVLNIETSDVNGKQPKDGDNGPTFSNKVTFGNPREGFAQIDNIAKRGEDLKVSKLRNDQMDQTFMHLYGDDIVVGTDENTGAILDLDGTGDLTQEDMNTYDAMLKKENQRRKQLFGLLS